MHDSEYMHLCKYKQVQIDAVNRQVYTLPRHEKEML